MSTATENGDAEVGEPPSGPTRLRFAEWKAVLRRTLKEFMGDDCMGLAQEIAYSALLAFFPAVAALIGLLGILHLFDDVQSLLGTVIPKGALKFINTLAKDSAGGTKVTAFVLGLAGATWAASGAMGSVIKAVNRAYDRLETRPFWKVRAISILLVVLTAVTTVGLFLLIVFGGKLGDAISRKAGLGSSFTLVWDILRWPLAFGAILIFFGLVYYLAPNRPQRKWSWVTPGSALGGVLWLALSGLFAIYVTFAGNYSKTYGAIASGIILLLWLNYSAWALLFGAELNAELDRQADIHAAGGENAGLTKLARRT